MYKLRLKIEVEALDAKFYFGAADKAVCKIIQLVQGKSGMLETGNVPDDLSEALCELFIEGVVEWNGVVGEDGVELECTKENKKSFPPEDKLVVASQYWEAKQKLEEKKV